MRTTLDIDAPILADLRRRREQTGKPMGRLVSDLLAQALKGETKPASQHSFHWTVRDMKARVDVADSEALYDALDGGES